MTDRSPRDELTCTHCGSPIRTTAAPGATVTCDCCGSANQIPGDRPSEGLAFTSTIVQGDVGSGDKIVAGGSVIVAGKGTVIEIKSDAQDDGPEAGASGEGP